MSLVHFVGRKELTARHNEREFIEICKEKLTLWSPLSWNALLWSQPGVSFTNLDQTSRVPDPANALHPGIADFCRAYLRFQQSHQPTKTYLEVRAIRCLEKALIQLGTEVDIHHITILTLDEAANIARRRFGEGAAYQAGVQIERLARFLSDKNLVQAELADWKSPIPRQYDRVRTGKEAQKERDSKLPHPEALSALATIFRSEPKLHRDIFTSCAAAIAICAPSRGTEILSLLEDCEVSESRASGGTSYGLRFFAGKNYPAETKWIPDDMVFIAKEAVARLKFITREARRIASWLEHHPHHFYRHANCPDVPEDHPLSEYEVARALGIECPTIRRRGELKRLGLPVGDGACTLRSLNAWVHTKLPASFPFLSEEKQASSSVRFSEALFCFQLEQLSTDAAIRPYMVSWPSINVFNFDLEPRQAGKSLFQRSETLGIDGSLKITTHQFRHYLNTLAMRGGLSDDDLARWSGRRNPRQNESYDQRSEQELVETLRTSGPGSALPSRAEITKRTSEMRPIKLAELDMLSARGVLFTDSGYCDHDFIMEPCLRHRDCNNCSEQICVKGDPRNDRMRNKLEKVEIALAAAQSADDEGDLGADRWVEKQRRERDRLKGFINIFDDPRVPQGTLIRLRSDVEFSRIAGILTRDHFVLTPGASSSASALPPPSAKP